MALQIFFGADEHTAKDGPYARLMSTRKWIYLSSALAILLVSGLYDERAVKAALKVIAVPVWLLAPAVATGLLYLLVQYGLLIRQLWVSYDIVMGERLAFRRADELAIAKQKVKDASAALEKKADDIMKLRIQRSVAAKEALENAMLRRDQAEKEIADLEYDSSLNAPSRKRLVADHLKDLIREISRLSAEARSTDHAAQQVVHVEPDEDLKEAQALLSQLRQQDPADRKGYRATEVLIDWLRLGPPVLLGAFAVLKLGAFML